MKHCFWILLLLCQTAWAVDYNLAFVASDVPDGRMAVMPAAAAEFATEESKLYLLHQDGTEELLYDPGPGKAVIDPRQWIHADGQWVYFTQMDGLTRGLQQNPVVKSWVQQRGFAGADIYKINVATRELVKLTDQTATPFAAEPRTYPKSQVAGTFGVLNLGACPLPNGAMQFTSDRETVGVNQLYVRHADGRIEKTGYLNLANCLNPFLLSNGRTLWSTHEDQGLRSGLNWGLWSSFPDGRKWEPEFSAFMSSAQAAPAVWKFHCEARTSDGQRVIVTTDYYGTASSGFGTFFRAPLEPRGFTHTPPTGWHAHIGAFFPKDSIWLTPWANPFDTVATVEKGKIGHPSPGRPGTVLCSWSPGPVHQFATAAQLPASGVYMDAGIYLLPIDSATTGPSQLVKVLDTPGRNEYYPVPLLTNEELYGREIPEHPFLPPPSDSRLLPGEPAGLIGTSSIYQRESKALRPEWNFVSQGSDSGEYDNSELHAVRIVTMEIHPIFGGTKLRTALNHHEKLRILGEIPLRKTNPDGSPLLDPWGDPDTSFLAKILADVPFTFQTTDAEGRVLNMAQTWHQLRAGEVRHDCGGCHSHTKEPRRFEDSAAGQPGYEFVDLMSARPKVLEFNADIKPIFAGKCNSCHDGTDPGAPVFDYENWVMPPQTGPEYRNLIKRQFSPYQSRTSLLMKHLRGDGVTRMPKNGDPLPPEQLRTVATWIDTGAATGELANADHTKPSVAISGGFAGAFDFNLASATINGQQVSTTNGRWPVSGLVEIVATDKMGNVARLTREAGAAPPPAPKTLEERVEDLERRVDALEQP